MSSSCMNLFIKLAKLPMSFGSSIVKPAYDPTNKNCIIISTHCNEYQTTTGIHKYDMVSNKSEIIYKYDGTFTPLCHGQFIDASNNTLILYGGCNNTFKIFDLNTNQMKQINDKNIISKCGWAPQNIFIPSPINEIHILDRYCEHYQFNITNKETIKIETNAELRLHNIKHPKLLYIKLLNKLYVFG
eukprot:234520_1